MARTLVFLADGFEEIEAMTIIDVLRRGQVEVTTCGLKSLTVEGAHGVLVTADALLQDVRFTDFDLLVLPGGEPGTTHLEQDERVTTMLQQAYAGGKKVAAICAAPRVLDQIGLLQGKKATSYPENKAQLKNCQYSEERVVRDGRILTSRGPGTAGEFAFALLDFLGKTEAAQRLRTGMLFA